ncbi:MAG: hypothetical protein Q8P80_03020 [Candidatus Levybacteria bacterium]|nr:hypothetical protein [Candidatus Levybacteria bacterium]
MSYEIRDANGRFVKKDTPPADTAKTTVEASTPNLNPPDPSFEKPLVSFSINNPFKRVLYWLNDIRKKQTTTFDFKIKIPLIALPVFIIVLGGVFQTFFTLGRDSQKQEVAAKPTSTPTPTQVVIVVPTKAAEAVILSKIGYIKATYQVQDLLFPTPVSSTSAPTVNPSPVPSRYVLLEKGDQIVFLLTPAEISLGYYIDRRVLATGAYDKITNTLKISKVSDLEILP